MLLHICWCLVFNGNPGHCTARIVINLVTQSIRNNKGKHTQAKSTDKADFIMERWICENAFFRFAKGKKCHFRVEKQLLEWAINQNIFVWFGGLWNMDLGRIALYVFKLA